VRVRITRWNSGSVDGIDLSQYVEGATYDLSPTLASYLLAQGWAVPVGEEQRATLPNFRTIQPPSVLVVEDDEDTRSIMTQLLEYHGWITHAAADGAEGLKALKAHRPSLILLDLAMPRMDGVEFRAAQMRLADRRLAAVPVVVVSAVHNAEDYQSSLNAAEVVTKPFEADSLLKTVEHHARPVSLFRW
jgi:CheY-like chemotaxis protein